MKKSNLLISLPLCAAFALSACGGSDEGGSGGVSKEAQRGTLLDSQVAGVNYSSPSFSGVTDPDGQFFFSPGETVTFSIGEIALFAARATELITLSDAVQNGSSENQTVINLGRFIQSLDDDNDLSNGIQIVVNEADTAGVTIDFAVDDATFGSGPAATFVEDDGRTLRSSQDSQQHIKETEDKYRPEGVSLSDILLSLTPDQSFDVLINSESAISGFSVSSNDAAIASATNGDEQSFTVTASPTAAPGARTTVDVEINFGEGEGATQETLELVVRTRSASGFFHEDLAGEFFYDIYPENGNDTEEITHYEVSRFQFDQGNGIKAARNFEGPLDHDFSWEVDYDGYLIIEGIPGAEEESAVDYISLISREDDYFDICWHGDKPASASEPCPSELAKERLYFTRQAADAYCDTVTGGCVDSVEDDNNPHDSTYTATGTWTFDDSTKAFSYSFTESSWPVDGPSNNCEGPAAGITKSYTVASSSASAMQWTDETDVIDWDGTASGQSGNLAIAGEWVERDSAIDQTREDLFLDLHDDGTLLMSGGCLPTDDGGSDTTNPPTDPSNPHNSSYVANGTWTFDDLTKEFLITVTESSWPNGNGQQSDSDPDFCESVQVHDSENPNTSLTLTESSNQMLTFFYPEDDATVFLEGTGDNLSGNQTPSGKWVETDGQGTSTGSEDLHWDINSDGTLLLSGGCLDGSNNGSGDTPPPSPPTEPSNPYNSSYVGNGNWSYDDSTSMLTISVTDTSWPEGGTTEDCGGVEVETFTTEVTQLTTTFMQWQEEGKDPNDWSGQAAGETGNLAPAGNWQDVDEDEDEEAFYLDLYSDGTFLVSGGCDGTGEGTPRNDVVSGQVNPANGSSVPADAFIRIVPDSNTAVDNYDGINCRLTNTGSFGSDCVLYTADTKYQAASNETYQVVVYSESNNDEYRWSANENSYCFLGENAAHNSWSSVNCDFGNAP